MPANPKYLSSGWVRTSKVLAAIVGAYMASTLPFVAYALRAEDPYPSMLTAAYTVFIIWPMLMILIFLIKKAWISWMVLLIIIAISSLIIFS